MGFLRYLLGTSDDYRAGVDDAEEVMEATDSDTMPDGYYLQNRWRQSGTEDVEAFSEGFTDRYYQESEPSFFKRWFSW